ncbi:MAG TPA: hypothetical protein VJL61_02620 [Rhodanobacteraceae bacterium]|nr:hypothetical protein [Rhodanobacteraceae bacterium]
MKILDGEQIFQVSGGQVGGEDETIPSPDDFEGFGDFLVGVAKGIWKEL